MSGKDISIAVLAAGNAGCSLASNMTLEGFDVSLAELPAFKKNIEFPMKKGGIEVTGELNTGFAEINKITMDIPDAIQGKDLIFITSPAFGHEPFTRECIPALEDGQVLIYIAYYGALRMAKLLKEEGLDKDVTVAELMSFFYACDRVGTKGAFFMERYQDDAKVLIKREKEGLPVAAFPATKTSKVLNKLRKLIPSLASATNVLETSLNNVNPISHPAGVMLNAGWIEHTTGGFSFYLEGQTPAVKKVAAAMDEEKMALAAALGFPKVSNKEWSSKMYARYIDPKTGNTHQEKYYKNIHDAPTSLKHRYLTEDVIYGLVPDSYIAQVAGVDMPTFNAIIHFSNLVNETNYWEEGMTLEKIGLTGMNVKEMLKFVNTGSI